MDENSIAIISNSHITYRSNDTEYPFRVNSNFYYLTGIEEESAVLILKKTGSRSEVIIFTKGNTGTNIIWTGPNLTVDQIKKEFLIKKVKSLSSLDNELSKMLKTHNKIYLDYNTTSKYNLSYIDNIKSDFKIKSIEDLSAYIGNMRLIKDEYEINQIKKAISITSRAFKVIMKKKSYEYEYEVQADIEYEFKKNASYSPAYETIVASGSNANILHYIKNDKKLESGDLILIDAGCEYDYYASDITRTIPVNNKYTKQQKTVYNIVLAAQKKIISSIKPGITKKDLQLLMEEELLIGMYRSVVFKTNDSLNEMREKKVIKKCCPHGVGHWMGLDVHDQSPYIINKVPVVFKAGMVLTIEPGLYLNDETLIKEEFLNIGIRIEDDILVTSTGYENLSEQIPKEIEEIEL